MSICRTFLKATRITADAKTRAAMKGAAVLGDASGYTVELQDASQIYVGRTCCRYCARVKAFSTVASRLEAGAPLCDYAKCLDTSSMATVCTADGFYRYVCHTRRILTAGFATPAALDRNARGFLETTEASEIMRTRYAKEYGNG